MGMTGLHNIHTHREGFRQPGVDSAQGSGDIPRAGTGLGQNAGLAISGSEMGSSRGGQTAPFSRHLIQGSDHRLGTGD